MGALLYSRSCWSLVRPLHTPYALRQGTKVIQSQRLSGEGSGGTGEKARSTAEEFSRQAKEKAESTSKAAKEAWDDFTDVVAGKSETKSEKAKEKYKEQVEKGNYDKIGQD